jgi:hypothetical protein
MYGSITRQSRLTNTDERRIEELKTLSSWQRPSPTVISTVTQAALRFHLGLAACSLSMYVCRSSSVSTTHIRERERACGSATKPHRLLHVRIDEIAANNLGHARGNSALAMRKPWARPSPSPVAVFRARSRIRPLSVEARFALRFMPCVF